jgi:polyhydroxybutyrate depolymerase
VRRASAAAIAAILLAPLAACRSTAPGPAIPGKSFKQLMAEREGPFPRSYRLHVPAGFDPADPTPRTLVVALHGGVARGAVFERQTGLSELADREGFFVVYPNGIGLFGLLRHWNGGWCCARALRRDVDDVEFLDRVVAEIAALVPIDPDRLVVVGYSNGGMLAYLYAARRSERVAGVGIFASSPGLEDAEGEPVWLPSEQTVPVPAAILHGTADPRLPVAGSRGDEDGRGTLGAREAAALWARRNGCAEEPQSEPSPRSAVEVLAWCDDGPAPVRLELLEGWGHDWPGPRFTDRRKAPAGLRGYHGAVRLWDLLRPDGRSAGAAP